MLRPPLRYYADIRQTISASDQEMNSALAELSRVRYHHVSPFCWANVWTHKWFQEPEVSVRLTAEQARWGARHQIWMAAAAVSASSAGSASPSHNPPPCLPPSPTSLTAIFISPKQNYTAEVNCLVALHELYKYINKYYDQVSRSRFSFCCRSQ